MLINRGMYMRYTKNHALHRVILPRRTKARKDRSVCQSDLSVVESSAIGEWCDTVCAMQLICKESH